jgi:hypothetical protein
MRALYLYIGDEDQTIIAYRMTNAPSSSSRTPNNATIHRNLTIKPFIKPTDSNDT